MLQSMGEQIDREYLDELTDMALDVKIPRLGGAGKMKTVTVAFRQNLACTTSGDTHMMRRQLPPMPR
ncbi:hypothetical protein Thi970DRAFT_00136 [Thiorhodovibrio frisius]|uniref:Uncharacterized protein n=2 Tax=Thiorhodovibrio frisius TaxID=631362 RepID=H8YVQ9_9GAMM|nr:hypothetical protein Thi970DRAFT_00136 [Thiorhodovibrio frisius]WPL23072.1 hypothetical protein Thiofri_03254 [Thiorhodovibrio frisius]